MNSNQPLPRIYQKNYENQLERILESAEKLFTRDGIDRVSMNAIANEARIARKTLYNYFPNKQEIAFEILKCFLEKSSPNFDTMHLPKGDGFMQLEAFIMEFSRSLERYPKEYRFIVEFNTLYARGIEIERVHQMFAHTNEIILPVIQRGIADGSIRADFDPDFLLAEIYILVSGMNNLFATVGDAVGEGFHHPNKDLYQGIFRIFLQGLRCATP